MTTRKILILKRIIDKPSRVAHSLRYKTSMYVTRCVLVLVLLALNLCLGLAIETRSSIEHPTEDHQGLRKLSSSGGIGAFSPPAPGFSRTGSADSSPVVLAVGVATAVAFAMFDVGGY